RETLEDPELRPRARDPREVLERGHVVAVAAPRAHLGIRHAAEESSRDRVALAGLARRAREVLRRSELLGRLAGVHRAQDVLEDPEAERADRAQRREDDRVPAHVDEGEEVCANAAPAYDGLEERLARTLRVVEQRVLEKEPLRFGSRRHDHRLGGVDPLRLVGVVEVGELPEHSRDRIVYARRMLTGVIHLPPLPGSPRSALTAEECAKVAVADARALAEAKFDAIIVENFGDTPFFAGRV